MGQPIASRSTTWGNVVIMAATSAPEPERDLTATSNWFALELSDASISVRLNPDLVDRLEREVIDSFKSLTSRGSEVGGILLGETDERPGTVLIEDYELVPCGYTRGPLYLLSDAETRRFEAAVRKWATRGDRLSPVGFFRSNTRSSLVLDDDDLSLVSGCWDDPETVALLVKPYSMKPSTASVFAWENGPAQGTPSSIQFPFKRSELLAKRGPAPASRRVQSAAPTPIPAKAEMRTVFPPVIAEPLVPPPPPVAAIVSPAPPFEDPEAVPEKPEPVAPIRAAVSPTPAPAPKAAAPPAQKPTPPVLAQVSPAPAPAPRAAAPATQKPTPPVLAEVSPAPVSAPKAASRPAQKPAPPVPAAVVPIPPSALPVDKKPVRETASLLDTRPAVFEELPPIDAGNLPSAFRPARPSWVLPLLRWGSLLLIGLVVFLGAVLGLRKLQFGGASQPDAAGGSSLSLRVERNAGQLYLNWNRNASVILNAQKAALIIMDGPQQQVVPLSLDELRTGGFVYSPGSSNVNFRLDLTRRGDGGIVSESIRSVVGRPSALGTAVAPPTPAPPEAAAPKAAAPVAKPVAQPATQPEATAPPAATQTEPAQPAAATETAAP